MPLAVAKSGPRPAISKSFLSRNLDLLNHYPYLFDFTNLYTYNQLLVLIANISMLQLSMYIISRLTCLAVGGFFPRALMPKPLASSL